jgi:hypothetical protein
MSNEMNATDPLRSWQGDGPIRDGHVSADSCAEYQTRDYRKAEGFVIASGRQIKRIGALAMNWPLSLAAMLLTFGLIVPAHGFLLINDDKDTYTLELLIGEDEPALETFTLNEGEAVEYECDGGCTIQLENGVSKMLMESDTLVIFEGEITIFEMPLERDKQTRLGL